MSTPKERAAAFVRSVAGHHLPTTARRYSWATYVAQKSVASVLGFQIDLSPQEGKVVAENDEFLLMKVGRQEFFVALKEALSEAPQIGSTCRVTPYARRRFDGKRLDASEVVDNGNGILTQTVLIGEYRSYLPIDKNSVVCPELREMIETVENERADGVRSIAQVLIDAGCLAEPVHFQDVPVDADIVVNPPLMRFRVITRKHDGYLEIVYDRALDSFSIVLLDTTKVEVSRQDFQFITPEGISTLGQAIIEAVDDGLWKIASVETLKKAPIRREAAAPA